MIRVVPADPAAALAGENATPAQVAEIRKQYGFDRPSARAVRRLSRPGGALRVRRKRLFAPARRARHQAAPAGDPRAYHFGAPHRDASRHPARHRGGGLPQPMARHAVAGPLGRRSGGGGVLVRDRAAAPLRDGPRLVPVARSHEQRALRAAGGDRLPSPRQPDRRPPRRVSTTPCTISCCRR